MLTPTRRIRHAAIVSALACALFATAAWPARTFAGERAYVAAVASLDREQIAAAYNPAWRGEPSSAAVGSSEADRLRGLERTRLQALVDADTTTARKLIARDFQLINPGGGESSRDEYMDAIKTGAIDYLVFKPSSPIAVRLSGDSAALRYQVSFDLIVGGDTHVTHQGWITELYERRHGQWQIVWEQATAIPNDFGLFVQSIEPVS